MSILLWILGIFVLLYGLLKITFIYMRISGIKYWKKLGAPYLESVQVPFLDRILEKKTVLEIEIMLLNKMKEANLKFAGISEIGTHTFVIRDPELAKLILIKDADIWMDRRNFGTNKNDPILSKMLFFMEGHDWKNMRSILSPNFTTGKIKKMFDRIDECAQMLMAELKKSENSEIEIKDTMSSYTMDVIASTFFGIEAHTIKNRNSVFANMGRKMQSPSTLRVLKIIFGIFFPKIASRLRLGFFEPESTNFFYKVVQDVITYREDNGIKRSDFLQLLIDYKNDDQSEKKVEINDQVIASQSVLFLLGGFDTLETLLSFSSYLLAIHPDLQEKMTQEVKQVMSKYEGQITYEAVNELAFCERFINETLRLYSPVPRIERRNNQDYQVTGTQIILPKNSLASFLTIAIQRDEDNFPNAEKFDPDRWLKGEKDSMNPYNYQPFGHGPRNCIGMRFALVEAKTILAHLVLNFKIEPTSRTPIPLKVTLKGNTMKPKGDIYLKLTQRSN